MTAEAPDNCEKCGRAKRSAVAGSLTQWLFSANACDCDFLKLAAEIDQHDFTADKLCSKCGKRLNEGRKGSLTQWVFRADICSCNREELSSADFSPSRLPLPEVRKKGPSYVPDPALTAQLGLSADRYVAIQLLGSGSAARVYKCWDKTLNKPVAIKQLVAMRLHENDVIRFQEEARSTSVLSHPSIVRVLDFGQNENSQPFMVMEFIDGKSLEALIEENGPMPVGVLVLIMISICAGMHHAHQSGVFHRDLKSSNIMIPLSVSAVPIGKVIDFGVAAMHKSGDDSGAVFQGHPIAGTPGYMSPDQLRGETFDQRSDIYSLGCTMFEALTGRVPFKAATSLDVFSLHANAAPPHLVDVQPEFDFPESLERIIAKALSKQKEDRYQSMLELKAALEEFLEENASSAPDAADDSTYGDNVEKRNMLPWAIALAAVVVVSISTFMWMKLTDVRAPKSAEESKPIVIKPALDEFTSGVFHLESTTMSDEKLKSLPKNSTNVDLVASDVTDAGMKYLIGLPIKILRVDATKITDEGLKDVAKITTLQELNIGDNPLITVAGLKHLESMPNLDFLSLNGTAIHDEELKSVSKMRLSRLSLGAMENLNGTGLVYVLNMPRLKALRLSGVELSPEGVECFAKLKNLEDFEHRKCEVTDQYINAIAGMKNMSVLNLSESTLNDKQLAMLSGLTRLRILRVEKCNNLTAGAIAKMARKLPKCRITDGQPSTF